MGRENRWRKKRTCKFLHLKHTLMGAEPGSLTLNPSNLKGCETQQFEKVLAQYFRLPEKYSEMCRYFFQVSST